MKETHNMGKGVSVGIILMLIFLLSLISVFAITTTIVNPVSGRIINDTFKFQTTCGVTGAFENVTRANWTITCGSTTVELSNTTANATGGTYTQNFTTTVCSDSSSVTYFARCVNTTSSIVNSSETTITIDNTAPTVRCETSKGTITKRGLLEINALRSFDLTTLSYILVLIKPDGTNVTSTLSKNEFSLGDTDQVGEYTARCSITDSAGLRTVSDNILVRAKNPEDITKEELLGTGKTTTTEGIKQVVQQKQQRGLEFLWLGLGFLSVLIILSVGLMLAVKKKKR